MSGPLSRRAALAGAVPAAAAVILPSAAATAAIAAGALRPQLTDPVFKAISEHTAIYARVNAMDPEDQRYDALLDLEGNYWWGLLLEQPTTLGGARAFARYITDHVARTGDDYQLHEG